MSYVLILRPTHQKRMPAIIGGYSTPEAAHAAGREALIPPVVRGKSPEDQQAWYQQNDGHPYEIPWEGYDVIPGVAEAREAAGEAA